LVESGHDVGMLQLIETIFGPQHFGRIGAVGCGLPVPLPTPGGAFNDGRVRWTTHHCIRQTIIVGVSERRGC